MFLINKGFYKSINNYLKYKFLFYLNILIYNLLLYLKLLNINIFKLNNELKRIFNKKTNNLKIIARNN
jgi:hypothetical protein